MSPIHLVSGVVAVIVFLTLVVAMRHAMLGGGKRLRPALVLGAARLFGAEGEGPSIYLQDPEGNTIELKGPPTAS